MRGRHGVCGVQAYALPGGAVDGHIRGRGWAGSCKETSERNWRIGQRRGDAETDQTQLGVQYAKAMGVRVIAVDAGDEKGKLCKELGAEEYLDFTKVKDLEEEVRQITVHGGTPILIASEHLLTLFLSTAARKC